MKAAKIVKPPAPGVGRPTLTGEVLRTRSFRCTEGQAHKLDALGGAEWLRAQIDSAAWPRGTKPKT